MNSEPKNHFQARLLLIAIALLCAAAGCGSREPVAQVAGKIDMKDSSLQNAGIRMVRFEPTTDTPSATRKGASGVIEKDGSFKVYTRRPGDGIQLGKYAVTFAFFRGAMDQKSLIPAKYTTAATTPYQVVIDRDRDDLNFEIESMGHPTSKGGK
jgi:hypothetical protein